MNDAQQNLFAPSEDKRKAPNLMELHAREKLGMPEEWKLFLYKCLPEDDDAEIQAYHLEGSIPVGVHKRGEMKGRPDYRNGEKRATAIISVAEHEAWSKAWHVKNNACEECHGEGRICTSVGIDGATFEPCKTCHQTGKRQ